LGRNRTRDSRVPVAKRTPLGYILIITVPQNFMQLLNVLYSAPPTQYLMNFHTVLELAIMSPILNSLPYINTYYFFQILFKKNKIDLQ
jgi:hypothetical protein